jgi:hypothetical protein
VQLTPAVKLGARVLVSDPVRDVAVVWVDAKSVASLRPVPLGCTATPPIKEGQEIVALAAPLRRARGTASGAVLAVEGRRLVADFDLDAGEAGGPAFAVDGRLVGVTSLSDPEGERGRGEARIVRIEEVCAAVSAAEPRTTEVPVPVDTRLPVEPERPFPATALTEAAGRTPAGLTSYRLSSSSFDVTFITPPLLHAARTGRLQGARPDAPSRPDPRTIDPLDDFANWAAYVAGVPPVLMIRATPKLQEGLWTRIARGAAQTQGVSLPPIKRFKPGFARLQAFCGDAEVTPVHPFRLQQRVSENDAIHEGLYVFEPAALGPTCGTVRLVLYSENEPRKGDARIVDPAVLQQIWEDFAPYRRAG